MTATLRLPRMLSDATQTSILQAVEGDTVKDVLIDLFEREPGLRNHILDEMGSVRPHVSVFVDGRQADITSGVEDGSEVRILHAVSGG